MSDTVYACITPVGVIRAIGPKGPIGFKQQADKAKNTQALTIPLSEATPTQTITIELSNAPTIRYRQISPGSVIGHGSTVKHTVDIAVKVDAPDAYQIKPATPKKSDLTIAAASAASVRGTASLTITVTPAEPVK